MKTELVQIVTMMLVLTAGVGIGMSVSHPQTGDPGKSGGMAVAPVAERKPLYYRNPMNPAITSKVPAKDEMGMDYVPVYADNTPSVVGTVIIDPATIQSMGVRTAQVRRQTLAHIVHAPGRIDFDEKTEARLHPKVQGWVDVLMANETGQQVKRGEVLLSIYSPNLVTSEQEYLLALQQLDSARKTGIEDAIGTSRKIADAARERLILLDVPKQTIKTLERTRKVRRNLDVVSPFDGTVTKVGAREGQYVTPASELFGIADLSRVWATVDVYEQDLPWIKLGDVADMHVLAAPGRTWTGRIDYIYPYMEATSRSVRVRLEFANDDGLLKPEMFATIDIHTSERHDAIVIPSEAIVRSGLQAKVFIAKPGGKFEPRRITTGISARDLTQVLEGVSPGEQVVTSAQFLIDSESKLNEAMAKMLEATSIDHGGIHLDKTFGGPMP